MGDSKKKQSRIPALSDAEWEVMKPLWKHGPMASRDIIAAIDPARDWSPKTVKSMLGRLVKKGVLTYDQVGNSYLYQAVHSQEAMTRRAAGSFLNRVFDGALTPFLAHFAQEVSDDELKRLRSELDRILEERQGED